MRNKIHQTIVASLVLGAIGLSIAGSSPAASAGMGGPGPTPHFSPGPAMRAPPPAQSITPGRAANSNSLGSVNDGGYSADSCPQYRPVYDRWGRLSGRQPTKIC
jgi:hypothetical protein